MLAHNLTANQIQDAKDLVTGGNIAEAWQLLSFLGDSYADNAAAVTGLPEVGTLGHEMNVLMRKYNVYLIKNINRGLVL